MHCWLPGAEVPDSREDINRDPSPRGEVVRGLLTVGSSELQNRKASEEFATRQRQIDRLLALLECLKIRMTFKERRGSDGILLWHVMSDADESGRVSWSVNIHPHATTRARLAALRASWNMLAASGVVDWRPTPSDDWFWWGGYVREGDVVPDALPVSVPDHLPDRWNF